MTGNIHFISAGAGSGKTYRLTQKLGELLTSAAVSPAGVIATTFTRLAAGELQERVRCALVEAGQVTVANQMEQALIGTVNGVCGEILRRFAFEAGMPPDQQVIDESQGDVLFYQAMEQALAGDRPLVRRMNALCQRLQIVDQRSKKQLWRQQIKTIVDAARANNQGAEEIRPLGNVSAAALLAHFPGTTGSDLNAQLLGAVNHALANIDTEQDGTKATRDYLARLSTTRAALIHRRLTWPEWISLSKSRPGAKSRAFAEPIIDIAVNFPCHPQLHKDLRDFTEHAFAIAADSLISYQEIKRQKGLIDFVDQEQRLYQLLDRPDVVATIEEELQLLMVDEFQDTSPIQLALFLKLSQLADQVIWVGDIKQSIYGFRGSDPALMDAVVRRVVAAGAPPEILEYSWRSSPELVAYANNLFVPAFADSLSAQQVALEPKRASVEDQPAVSLWRLQGRRKEQRANALASGLMAMMGSDRSVVDKSSGEPRPLRYNDIAILCRTNGNLGEIAAALAAARLPVRYKRPGLLNTPECALALAALRRLIDPLDTLASAEITSLTSCDNPEAWITQRTQYLDDTQHKSHRWLEDEDDGPVLALKTLRDRLPYLTPLEALRAAIDAAGVYLAVRRWGPTEQRTQHRLNNLAALLDHAGDYLNQCSVRNEPATAAGLVLWLRALNEAEKDTQASGGDEDAIQLVTHHGAKGLEWPIVIAMDLHSELRPRLWGLSVIPAPGEVSLSDPLAQRTLRYWPHFFGNHSSNIDLLDDIAASPEGQTALERETLESRRLLYVSLTRPRDGLILTMENKKTSGPWMETLQADWMLPEQDTLAMPDGTTIPCSTLELEDESLEQELPAYRPKILQSPAPVAQKLPLRKSPSGIEPVDGARVGEIIELGARLNITGDYDPATLGSALHAVIAATIMGHDATARILTDHGVQDSMAEATADECAHRLLQLIEQRFAPVTWYAEYPVSYTDEAGQAVAGWIDLLLETADGFVLIDHKASPRSRSQWQEIALAYSGQLSAYSTGITLATGKPVVGQWIHFAVTGALVSVEA